MYPAPKAGPPSLKDLLDSAWIELRGIVDREVYLEGDAASREHPTSILDEAVLRLLSQRSAIVDGSQLRGLITIFVRRILADRRRRSRRHHRLLRRAEGARNRFSHSAPLGEELAEALGSLQRHDERKFMAITMSAIDRLPQDVIASVLGTSLATVERDLRFSRAWIASRLDRDLYAPRPLRDHAIPGRS